MSCRLRSRRGLLVPWSRLVRPAPQPTLLERQRLGRYETLFRLAAGGMAEVHVARMVGEGGFEKLVAIKRMLPSLAADERFVGMFLDEGRVAANISSPNVVATLDLGRADDDSLYLVMELVVGVALSTLRAANPAPMPVDLATEIIAQAALGLHDAHEARTAYGEWLAIVHRDVSPQNILVDVAGRVRITDFGVARAIERVTRTESGEVKGKLAYFAPEQARAKPLDRRADVFALGIVAWELLTGRRLFAGESPADTVIRVLEMPVPRVDEIRPEVPAALADAVARALDRDVYARTETAGALAKELRAAVPAVSPSDLGALVRERGGEALRRIERGIRERADLEHPAHDDREPSRSGTVPVHARVGSEDVAEAAPATVVEQGSFASGTRRTWIPAVTAVAFFLLFGVVVWASSRPEPPGSSQRLPALAVGVPPATAAPAAPQATSQQATPAQPPATASQPPPATATQATATQATSVEASPVEASPAQTTSLQATAPETAPSVTGTSEPTHDSPSPVLSSRRVATRDPALQEPADSDTRPTRPPRLTHSAGPRALRGLEDFESEVPE